MLFDDEDDRPVPPPTVPVYRGPPCKRCDVNTVVDFQLANCTNPHCGVYAACQCAPAAGPEPYTTRIESWGFYGVNGRDAVFCRRCGDELRAP